MIIDETTDGGRSQVGLIGHVQECGFIKSVVGRHWIILSKRITLYDECLKRITLDVRCRIDCKLARRLLI